MTRRLSFLDDDSQEMGLGSLLGAGGAGGAVGRRPSRGTRHWNPSDSLAGQPFHGFPGGRRAWESFKLTGEVPDAALGLSPQARDYYYARIPQQDVDHAMMNTDPDTGMILDEGSYANPSLSEPTSPAMRLSLASLTGSMGDGITGTDERSMEMPGSQPLSQTPNAGLSYEGTPNKGQGWADIAHANTYADFYADSFTNANTYGYADTYYANPVNFNYGRQNASTTPGQQTSPNGSMGAANPNVGMDPLGRLLGMR